MKDLIHLNAIGVVLFKLILFIIISTFGLFFFDLSSSKLYFILIILIITSIIWTILYKKRLISNIKISILQLSTDVFMENILIIYSGGIDSPFIFLLILDLFLGVYILPKKFIFILTAYVAGLHATFSTLSFLNFLPHFLNVEQASIPSFEIYFYYVVFMRTFVFGMMGYLATQLSGRLSSQKETIKQIQNLNDKILYQMGIGLISINQENKIIYSNKAASNILGYSNEELQNKNWHSFFFGNEEDITNTDFFPKAYSKDGAEIYITKKNFEDIPIEISLSDFTDETSNFKGKTIIFRDVTFLKEMESLKIEKKRIETLGDLAAALAHEIKNPLASICGSLEVLKESNAFDNSKLKKLVHVIFKESERLGRTLNEFLTFSNEIHFRKHNSNIIAPIEEILLVLEHHYEVKPNIKISLEYKKNETYVVFLDDDYLKQLIFNLVLNGVQAIDDPLGGKVIVKLQKIEKNSNKFVQIQIIDTGKGIPEDKKSNVFKPFFSSRTKGIGLGLNVCLKVSQQHGWDLYFEDNKPKGTIFNVLIPIY